MNTESKNISFKIIGIIGALYIFLVGINGMSSAIKNMGSNVAETIFTTNYSVSRILISVSFSSPSQPRRAGANMMVGGLEQTPLK